MNSKPSPMCRLNFTLLYPTAINGRYFLESSTTRSSISTWSIFSTNGCLATSLATPPSPPPTMSTCFHKIIKTPDINCMRKPTNLFRRWVTEQRQERYHFLISILIVLCALNHPVEHQYNAMRFPTKCKQINS